VKKKSGRVRIRGSWWKIEIKQLAPTKINGEWQTVHGLCDYAARVIFLNPQFDMQTTLLHEVTHACQPDLDEPTVEQIEEAHVNAMMVFKKISCGRLKHR
jgi:hypothetical protein